ncbi:hypothetical protein ACHAWF_012259 [Thalassiosira exigua]
MKQFLLTLTGLAFVATSIVQALDFPKIALRGSPQRDDIMFVELASVCRRGEREGRNAMRRAWERMGEDCNDTIGRGNELKRKARKLKTGFKGGNWRKRESNRCARSGIETEEQAILKKCLDTSTDVCTELAQAAAERIVRANKHRDRDCKTAEAMAFHHHNHRPNYRKECRQMAYDTCPGEITNEFRNECNKSPSGSLFRDMRDECKSTVNDLLGRGDEAGFVNETN